jgi:hypothetical protein
VVSAAVATGVVVWTADSEWVGEGRSEGGRDRKYSELKGRDMRERNVERVCVC